jgi:hypothetical protein
MTINRLFQMDILFRFAKLGPHMAARIPKLEVAVKFRDTLMDIYPTRINTIFAAKGKARLLKKRKKYPAKITYFRMIVQDRYLPHFMWAPWIMPPDTAQTSRSTTRPTISTVPITAAPTRSFSVIKMFRKLPIAVEDMKAAREYNEYLNISVFVIFRSSTIIVLLSYKFVPRHVERPGGIPFVSIFQAEN